MPGIAIVVALAIATLGISTFVYLVSAKETGSRLAALAQAILVAPLALVFVVWLSWSIWSHFQDRTDPIPEELQIASTELVEESAGLSEGCGILIFRLTEPSRLDLQRKGLSKLENARTGRDNPGRHQYDAWQPVPAAFSPRGLACVDIDENDRKQIHEALGSGYVTQGYEFDLFVNPISGLVVYSYVD